MEGHLVFTRGMPIMAKGEFPDPTAYRWFTEAIDYPLKDFSYQLYLWPEYMDADVDFVVRHRVRLCSFTELIYEDTPLWNAYIPREELTASSTGLFSVWGRLLKYLICEPVPCIPTHNLGPNPLIYVQIGDIFSPIIRLSEQRILLSSKLRDTPHKYTTSIYDLLNVHHHLKNVDK